MSKQIERRLQRVFFGGDIESTQDSYTPWGERMVETGEIFDDDRKLWDRAGALLERVIDPRGTHAIPIETLTEAIHAAHDHGWNYAMYTPSTMSRQHISARSPGEMVEGYSAAFGAKIGLLRYGSVARPVFSKDESGVLGKAFAARWKKGYMLDYVHRHAVKEAYADGPCVQFDERVSDIPFSMIVAVFVSGLQDMGISDRQIREILANGSKNRLMKGEDIYMSEPGADEWGYMTPDTLRYVYEEGLFPPYSCHPAATLVRKRYKGG